METATSLPQWALALLTWVMDWSWGALGLVVGLVAVFGAAVLLGQVALRALGNVSGRRRPSGPPPAQWANIVRKNFTASRGLSNEDFASLLGLIQIFVADKHFEGAQGFQIDDEVRVTIAAQACYLILALDVPVYPRTRTVLVYPSTFVPIRLDDAGQAIEEDPSLGEAWDEGTVILAWDSSLQGGIDPSDGSNLVFHEFAHQLDGASGEMSGNPAGLPMSALKPWARVLAESHEQLKQAAERGLDVVLDHYGASDEVEFFAVATEAFFERPRDLRGVFPDLYQQLVAFYGRDPAESDGVLRRHPDTSDRRE
ncbi:MAG: zinc-dependent peptidase [Longimicrobiales bacterium]